MENTEACVQLAVLFTTSAGQRRVRLHTISVPVTAEMPRVFRSSDMDAVLGFFIRNSVSLSLYLV